jgi:polysaccharide biosynthesis transport protein
MLELKKPVALTSPSLPSFDTRSGLEAERRVPLRDYWGSIRKHWWLVCGLTVLVTAIAATYLVRKPDIYESQALVMVDLEELNPVAGAASKNPVIVNGTVNDPAYFNTQLRLLTSQGLLRRVVKTLDLEHNTTFPRPSSMPGRAKWWANLQRIFGGERQEPDKVAAKETNLEKIAAQEGVSVNSQLEATEAKRLAPFVKDITEELHVEPVVEKRLGYSRDNTRLIEIQYQHHEPEIAAKVVNGIADAFVLLNLERRSETNVTTGDFLQKRIAELQSQIRNGDERLMNYARNHQILSLDANQNMVVERLTLLNKQLLEAENKRKVAEAAYRAALAPGAASALAEESAANSKKLTDLETKLADMRQHRARLMVENTEEWPEVKEVNQQIGALEEEVRNARGRSTSVVITNYETQYRQTLAAEQALRKAYEQQRGDTLTQNEAAINYRIIQQETETNKNLLDGLLQRYKENDVVLAGLRKNIHIIDYAIPADKPIGPRRWQGMILVFCLSLVFSIGLALFLEYFNDTINSSDEAEKMLQVPTLVTIPIASELRERKFHPDSLFTTESHSALAESYRQLRTSLLLASPGHPPKTLLVTSSLPGEGKTTTAVNLAFCLAQIGARVLILDADLRRPRLHSVFGVSRQPGLSNCLVSRLNEAQTLEKIRQYNDTRLHLLTAGPVPLNPAELLGSEDMRQLLTGLKAHFTHIIIDSPPSASFTDAVLLSSMADGILLVVQSGKTKYKVVRHSLNLLAGAGAKIFGVVLNQVNHRQHEDYYQHYYQQPTDSLDTENVIEAEILQSINEIKADPAPATLAAEDNENEMEWTEEAAEEAWAGAPQDEAAATAALEEETCEETTHSQEERFHALCMAFDHPSPTVREEAAQALYQFSENPVAAFTQAIAEASFARSRRIGAAMASSGLAATALNQLTSGHKKYYEALSLLLLMLKAGEAEPLLRAIKMHTNHNIRLAAISLLTLSQQKEYLAELRRIALQDALPEEVQAALLTALRIPSQGPLKKSAGHSAKSHRR